jgi:hypothetical protein
VGAGLRDPRQLREAHERARRTAGHLLGGEGEPLSCSSSTGRPRSYRGGSSARTDRPGWRRRVRTCAPRRAGARCSGRGRRVCRGRS